DQVVVDVQWDVLGLKRRLERRAIVADARVDGMAAHLGGQYGTKCGAESAERAEHALEGLAADAPVLALHKAAIARMRKLDRLATLVLDRREVEVGVGQDLEDLARRTGDVVELGQDALDLGRADMRALAGQFL